MQQRQRYHNGMRRKSRKRRGSRGVSVVLSLFVVLCLFFSSIPFGVYADSAAVEASVSMEKENSLSEEGGREEKEAEEEDRANGESQSEEEDMPTEKTTEGREETAVEGQEEEPESKDESESESESADSESREEAFHASGESEVPSLESTEAEPLREEESALEDKAASIETEEKNAGEETLSKNSNRRSRKEVLEDMEALEEELLGAEGEPFPYAWAILIPRDIREEEDLLFSEEGFPSDIEVESPSELRSISKVRRRRAVSQVDLSDTDWIRNIRVSKKSWVNGNEVWVPATEFADGDTAQIRIDYEIPLNGFPDINTGLYYKLPDGFRLDNELSGHVYGYNNEVIGEFRVSPNGEIHIDFNHNFDTTVTEIGRLVVEGRMENSSAEEDKSFHFPGSGTTITIKKKPPVPVVPEDGSDIKVHKEAELTADEEYIDYAVTVSTEKGSSREVNILDKMNYWTNAAPEYLNDSFQLIHKTKNGESPLDIQGYGFTQNKTDWSREFGIFNLPKLEAGESYELRYRVKINPKEENQDIILNNGARGQSGPRDEGDNNHTEIKRNRIRKEGYSTGKGEMQWIITVNESRGNLQGYHLIDHLPDGITLTGPVEIKDMTDGWKTVSGLNTGKKGDSSIDIDFSVLGSNNHSYNIRYVTTAPEVPEGQDSVDVTNTAELTDGPNSYTSEHTIKEYGGHLGVQKKVENGYPRVTAVGKLEHWWWSNLTLSGRTLKSLEYTDIIKNAVSSTDHNPEERDRGVKSHYTLASELSKALDNYKNFILRREHSGGGYEEYEKSAGNKTAKYRYELECYDEEGNLIPNTDSEQLVKSFKVTVTPEDGEDIQPTLLSLHYPTYSDISDSLGGENWTFPNRGEFTSYQGEGTGLFSEDKDHYTVERKVRKQASPNGQNASYKSEDLEIDMEASQGMLYYRLLAKLPKENGGIFRITDNFPEGMELVEESLSVAFYDNDYYSYPKDWNSGYDLSGAQKPQYTLEKGNGPEKLVIELKEGFPAEKTVEIRYQVSVKNDPRWLNMSTQKLSYLNTVDIGGETDYHNTVVKRDVPPVKKSARQLTDASGAAINRIEYTVEINPAALDLNPKGETIVLTDKLKLPEGMDANLDLKNTSLYLYDPVAENHLGPRLDRGVYSLTYQEEEHLIRVEIEDHMPAVLVYQYVVDSGSFIDPTISNSAELAGHYSDVKDFKLNTSSSHAQIQEKKIRIYKVDAEDYTRFLEGAGFEMEIQSGSEWQSVDAASVSPGGSLVTGEDGTMTLTNMENNRIYRLEETEAPDGYTLEKKPYYLAWMDGVKTKEEIWNEAPEEIRKEIQKQSEIHFIRYTGGFIYVPNQYKELKVSKLWLNADGTTGEPGAEKVEIKLYQMVKKLNSAVVQVEIDNAWGNGLHIFGGYQVEKDTPLTVRIENGTEMDSVTVNGKKIELGAQHLKSYTINSIKEDTLIQIKTSGWYDTSSVKVDFTSPQLILLEDSKKLLDTITLSKEESWTKVWTELPRTDENGDVLAYQVEETPVAGYTTSYRRNTGNNTGEILVLNRKNSSNYVLPETGGMGRRSIFLLGAALMLTGTLTETEKRTRKQQGRRALRNQKGSRR